MKNHHFEIFLRSISIVLLFFIFLFISSCSKDPQKTEVSGEKQAENPNRKSTTAGSAVVESTCTSGCWIGTVNQASQQVELYDRWITNWDDPAALHWLWKPTTGLGFTSTEVSQWYNPNDFKIRYVSAWGGNYIAAVAGGGLVAISAYPSGVKKWAAFVGSSSAVNLHGVELLPDGCVAVAVSTGDFIRVYKSSTGATTSATATLNDAHQVLWDPLYDCLWAVGANMLQKYAVNTTGATPVLTLVTTYTIPTSWAHALGAMYGDTDKLYVASNTNVYVFDKTAGTFTPAPGNLNMSHVKAISNNPAGVVIRTRPDASKVPVPASPSPGASWTTSYVDYYTSAGTYVASGHKTGASFYRGFVYNTLYQ